MADQVYFGRCDTCADALIGDLGIPGVRVAKGMKITFRFCSDACRESFFDRDDPATVPEQSQIGGNDDA